jgi:hypothetical protein
LPAFVEALEFIDLPMVLLPGRMVEPPARGGGLCRVEARCCRLPRQERFSRRHHRPFRRHRFALTLAIAVDALGADQVRA